MAAYRFTNYDYPDGYPAGTTSTSPPTSINDSGEIVGTSRYTSGRGGYRGYLDNDGDHTTIQAPSGPTYGNDVNNFGMVAGTNITTGPAQGYMIVRGVKFVPIVVPRSSNTTVGGINDHVDTVGAYAIAGSQDRHGFIRSSTDQYTIVDRPGAGSTVLTGINNNGRTVGYSIGSDNVDHGFVRNKAGKITGIDVLGAKETLPSKLNDQGEIVGHYVDSAGATHGFLDINGHVSTLDIAGASFTTVTGINNNGDIVGSYLKDGHGHGFIATTELSPSDLMPKDHIVIKPELGASAAQDTTPLLTPASMAAYTQSDQGMPGVVIGNGQST